MAASKHIYFIQCGAAGPIKVGICSSVPRRVAALQVANPIPLVLLAAIPGQTSHERHVHRMFAPHRVSGEWFAPTPELLDAIERWRVAGFDFTPERVHVRSLPLTDESGALDSIRQAIHYIAWPIQVGENVAAWLQRAAAVAGLPEGRVRSIHHRKNTKVGVVEFYKVIAAARQSRERIEAYGGPNAPTWDPRWDEFWRLMEVGASIAKRTDLVLPRRRVG